MLLKSILITSVCNWPVRAIDVEQMSRENNNVLFRLGQEEVFLPFYQVEENAFQLESGTLKAVIACTNKET